MSGAALARAVEAGHVKALLLMGGLPSASHPIRSLMGQVPLVIATTPWSEPETESLRLVALPSPLWVEKDGTLTGAAPPIRRASWRERGCQSVSTQGVAVSSQRQHTT